eukprot:symbB.v1.2.024036.t1/scaffold2247.1/size84628/9
MWPECSMDFCMWIGNMAVLLGLRRAPRPLQSLATELFTEVKAVQDDKDMSALDTEDTTYWLQEEVLQALLIVVYSQANPLRWQLPGLRTVVEEPCLVYDLDIVIAPTRLLAS